MSAEEIRELFDPYLEGAEPCIALIASTKPLADTARTALGKSFASFGYGEEACTYVTLAPSGSAATVHLDPQALFLLVEGLDPVCVICADADAAELFAQAYRASFAPDAPARVLGRPAAVFRDFTAMLATEKGKQDAWHLLKSLPRR